MRIVWDEPKRLTNLEKRGLDFSFLDVEFFADAMVVPTRLGRFKAIGWFEDRPTTMIFKPLGSESISIISMRHASRKERTLL